jgi:hypothetical protein
MPNKRPWKGKTPTCGHPERSNKAFGKCWACYEKDRDNPLIHPPEFTIKGHCVICGDGYGERKCQLHLTICDACHTEYCECSTNLKLVPLEDIAQFKDEKRIPLLFARKVALRAAGKNTNSIPLVSIAAHIDERVGVMAERYHNLGKSRTRV